MLYFTLFHIRPPKYDLKIMKWSVMLPWLCSEVWVPGNSDKSHFVKGLYDGEVDLDILRDFMKLDAYLADIVKGSTR